ncbi:MAG: ABC transporter ATP-binding protein [Erysipelotrichaceae bacterium]|nr:ABC transporter ATP-binding protein [Erysipelotrichaceae bacterium]
MAPRGLGPRGFLTDEEKENKPQVSWPLIKRIFSYLTPYWFPLLLVLIIILVSSVVGLLPSIITGKIIDTAILGKDFDLLIKLIIAAIGTLTLSQVIGVLESYINSWVSSRIVCDMKNEMFQHLQTMPHSFFTTEKQGDIITRMNSDISGVSSAISSTLTNCISNIATVVTTIVALLKMDSKLAIIGILVIPLLVLPTKSAGKNRWKLLSESQKKTDELNDLTNEALSVSGSLLIKLFCQEENKNKEFARINKEVTDMSVRERRAGQWFRVVMGIFTNLGPLLIYLAGGYLIIKMNDTTLTVGTITATVNMINRLYRPVESLLSISVDFTRSLALFSRIFEYLDMKPSVVNRKNALKPEFKDTNISYNHVEFYYNEDVPLIKDLSFKVPSGKMYAIVGPSGSGKSTVVNLLPRLYDVVSGSITINGRDIRDIDLTFLRNNIGMVTQEAYMFNGTIADNLRFAKINATDEELVEACKIANIHDFIVSQPDGYNTQVGNRGLKLSGGEKQRLSIARVILKNPRILILDEATSSLDSISESSIQNALDVMMVGRTSIVIAHRLSTILAADRILVISDGRIAEEGQHEELLAKGGIYKQLYETQFRKVIDMESEKSAEK